MGKAGLFFRKKRHIRCLGDVMPSGNRRRPACVVACCQWTRGILLINKECKATGVQFNDGSCLGKQLVVVAIGINIHSALRKVNGTYLFPVLQQYFFSTFLSVQ
jgi:hypothetical protein